MSRYFVHPDDCPQMELSPGVRIHTMAGTGMMLSVVELRPNAIVEEHDHRHEQIGILLEGELEFTVANDTEMLRPGDMWRIPGSVPHRVVAGADGARALDIFHPVREDYQ